MKKKKWILPVSIIGSVFVLCIVAALVFGGMLGTKESGVSIGVGTEKQSAEKKTENNTQEKTSNNATQTTIYFNNGKSQTFMSENSATMTDILENLKYDKNKICYCMAEYDVDTELSNRYGINLTEGYARCDKGQAELTQEQIDKLREIILWAKEKAGISSDVGTHMQPEEEVFENATQTTIYFGNGKSYTFISENSEAMTEILANLKYDKNKICKCMAEYNVDTELGNRYGINLTEGYARCDKGQAKLTQEQIDKLREIILWAKEEAGVE